MAKKKKIVVKKIRPKKKVLDESASTMTFVGKSKQRIRADLAKRRLGLTVSEAKRIQQDILGRKPTVTEMIAFNEEGSEHCSYRSSRKYLPLLPTKAPNVILGPGEDAGIVSMAEHNGIRYGVVVAHESHNHPSQIVPYEGAATGIGGIVRDVVCMGARVIATADPLRFGSVKDKDSLYIYDGVVAGISGYGNPIGVPNIGGDVYFDSSFSGNCLVNVMALGVVAEPDIIHSRAPEEAGDIGYDIILLGKPTDNSGFGGASLASDELKSTSRAEKKGAVQEPNAFLKRHLLASIYDMFAILKEKKLLSKVGFKDVGGGGLLCASVEIADAGGFGADVDISKINVSMEGLPGYVRLCAETQERFVLAAHPDVTPLLLDHFNRKWALHEVSRGAAAVVVGKITKGNYVVRDGRTKLVDAPAEKVTEGLRYDREQRDPKKKFKIVTLPIPHDLNKIILEMLSHENIASREVVYERYDKNVQGQVIIESGEADAGVIAPFLHGDFPEEIRKVGTAVSVDANPRYGEISPFWQAVNAVAESMRNVAAVGAVPWALTDCLNYGNPEKQEQMWEFVEGVKGLAQAAMSIHLKGHAGSPVPIISGNVSFYNESPGSRISPQAVVGCIGRLENYERAITHEFKESGNMIYLIGKRETELGGSVYHQLHNQLGENLPKPRYNEVALQMYALTEAIDKSYIRAAHDISDGGMMITLAEMCFGGRGKGKLGAQIDVSAVAARDVRIDARLFSETGGFLCEVPQAIVKEVEEIFSRYGIDFYAIGKTTKRSKIVVNYNGTTIVDLQVSDAKKAWTSGLRDRVT